MTTLEAKRSVPASPAESATATNMQRGSRGWGVVVLCGLASITLLLGVAGSASAALLMVAITVVPGVFVVDHVSPRDQLERLVVMWAVSLTSWMIVAHVLLSLQWWHPQIVTGLLLAVATAAAEVRRRRIPPTQSDRPGLAAWLSDIGRTQLLAGAAAVGLWAWSLTSIDVADIDDWGLVSVLPPSFFIAYVIALAAAATAATTPTTNGRRVAFSLAPLLVMIYGTLPLLVDTIRYPWAYKHVGVIRLLDESGRLHPDVDIYNNFSGFFGLGALVRGATGVDPTAYAAWTQLVAEALILCAVWVLVRRATDSARVAHLAVVLYLITNWVAQNYFAAQTLGSLLSLATLGLIASWFVDGRTRRLRGLGSRLGGIAPLDRHAPGRPIAARRAVVLVSFLGVMMTHPLTPAATLGAVTLAWIIGWVRDRTLIAGMYAVALLWAFRSIAYFAAQDFDLGFGGSPSDNADGNLDYSAAPEAVVLVGDLTRLFSVGVWAAAAIGALLCAWAMRRIGMLAVAAAIPFGIPFVQSYGGEAIYRVYLYSLPLVVAFIAWGIVTRSSLNRSARVSGELLLAVVLCLLLGAGFLIAHFGRERINNVDSSEVAMGDYIGDQIPDPAVLAQFDGAFPAASTARYPSFQVNDTYVPEIVELLEMAGTTPTLAELDEVADDLYGLDAGTPFVIVSPGMIEAVLQIASLPVATTEEAVEMLIASSRFSVRHRIGDTWLIEVHE